MASQTKLIPLADSDPVDLGSAKRLGPANPDELITVTVKVRAKDANEAASASLASGHHVPVTREAFGASHGADPAVLKKIQAYAAEHKLGVVESCPARRRVVLHGRLSDVASAFGAKIERYEFARGTYRACISKIHLPADLAPEVEAVLGLSNRPAARPHFQFRRTKPAAAHAVANAAASPRALTPLEVASLYNFPGGLDGSGQCIAIIELGGGFIMDDLRAYFSGLGVPMPEVVEASVLGGKNTPGSDADGEVMLDIEVAGAVAPAARIVVYFAPNTTQGFIQAISNAAHDASNKPSIISISWGGPESSWRNSDKTALNNALRDAALLGVTVTVAAGDNGSDDGAGDGKVHVDFPSSSPFALACGGTRLVAGSGAAGPAETVWDDGPNSATGGGVSDFFPLPSYQSGAGVPTSQSRSGFAGRGVPDVAGDADPESGYKVRVDGSDVVVGGTSAVAPLWAGLVALINQKIGKPAGFLNPLLYSAVAPGGGLRDITSGNNGAFSAGPGWDACTGLGSPIGSSLLALLESPGAGGANGATNGSASRASGEKVPAMA